MRWPWSAKETLPSRITTVTCSKHGNLIPEYEVVYFTALASKDTPICVKCMMEVLANGQTVTRTTA